jgi:type IV secretory pathway VirB4 component
MFSLFPQKKSAPVVPESQSAGAVMAQGQVSVKDLVAPSFIETDYSHIKIDSRYYRTLYVVGYPRYVSSNWLYNLITFDHPLFVSMFIYPTESKEILDDLKKKISQMQATIEIDLHAGKAVDPMVQVQLDDALVLQSELAKGSERFFQFGLYVTIPADTKEELDNVTKEVDSSLASLLIVAKSAILEQDEGFRSTLPMFSDKLKVWRNMDTTSLAMTFPFSTASLTRNEGILYGINQHDGSLIIFDRFTLENANSVILGKSGGGKSFLVKLEALRLLMIGVDVIILDPENEYAAACKSLGGEFVEFSATSNYKINPFELPQESIEPDDLQNKILDLHSLLKIMMGELTPAQDAMLDRALVSVYQNRGITPDPTTFKNPAPYIEDLYKVFLGMETSEAAEMATRLEKYVKGSASGIFNQQSSFDIKNPFTVFGIRDLEESLRPVAMYIVLDFIWNRIKKEKKRRVLIVDEAWYLIKHKDSAAYLRNFAKRSRKYGMGMTTITQDVEDFLSTEDGKAIITNSSLQIILKQSTAAVDKIAETFYLTGGEKHFLLSAGVGEGLFFASQNHVGFRVIASDEERQLISA